ncbi:hypothetical protein ASPCAL12343 [Aspergillus calidoustus]|uniref:Nephrocystin 3-like N-terminal domain-containing protein n=1 Tax=Aspergillus calidoustus TaxID=454130 RepID=A0A0U5H5I7_ASPCI|nr:hypothetical protein ASPCAL12343 [Aspergillus calidoustus]
MDRIEAICLPGTQTELLLDIQRWAIAADGKCIFWLNSLAGTGKSTIARTVAKAFQEQGLLGASFFFKRGEGDRGNAARFFPTIIQQLSSRIPELRAAILQVIQDNPEISTKSLKEQFNELIYKPFRSLNQASLQNSPLVVVVDALDECEHDNDIQVLLQLFPRVQEFNSPCLRFFITSRPELPIRSGFRGVDYHDLSLHEIPQPIIERDIAFFLQHKMAIIREQRKLPSDWPEKDDIQALLTVSAPSFIVAATVCSHLQNHNLEPTQYLNEVVARLNEVPKIGEPPLAVLNRLFGAQTEYGPQPSADYGNDAGIEGLLYDQSDIESIFSEGSILSSQSSQSEITSIAISELAELLLTDNELQNLWPTAISKVGPDRFQRNFTRILRKFGRNLEGEALNEIQCQAAHFVRLSAQQTAAQLCNLLKQDRSNLPIEQSLNASRTARVNAWLQSQKVGHTKRQVEGLLEVDVTGSSTDSDADGSEEFEPASLSSIDDVKLFLLSANAFLLLREEFKKWLEVKRTDSVNPAVQKNFQFSDPEITQDSRFGDLVQSSTSEGHHHEPVQFREDCDSPPEGASTVQMSTNGMVISLSWWQRLLNIYSPPVAGYERIYYRCVSFCYLHLNLS